MGSLAISDFGFWIAEFKSRCQFSLCLHREILLAFAVLLHFKAYLHIRACNCKRAIEWSTRLELLNQTVRLFSRNALQKQIKARTVENHYIGAHRMLAIDPTFDLRAYGSQRNRISTRT